MLKLNFFFSLLEKFANKKYTEIIIKKKLDSIGIPKDKQDIFIKYQLENGGKSGGYGRNRWTFGIIHSHPQWLDPDSIDLEFDEKTGTYWITCCDGHPSDLWTINELGQVAWSGFIKYDNYSDFIKEYIL